MAKHPKTVNAPQTARAPKKNMDAVRLGKLGGLKGGPERAKRLSAEQLAAIGRYGAQTRWARARGQEAPPPLRISRRAGP